MINSINTFLVSLEGPQIFIIFIIAILLIAGVVAFKLNYTQQIRVSLYMDDECEIFNHDGIVQYIKGHKKGFTKPSLLAVQLENLEPLYNSNISDKHQMMVGITDCMLKGLSKIEMIGRSAPNIFVIAIDNRDKDELKEMCHTIEKRIMEYRIPSYGSYNFVINFGINQNVDLSDAERSIFNTLSVFDFSTARDGNIFYYNDVVDSAMGKYSDINTLKDVALEGHQFQAFIQPKVNIGTGKTIGGEILCRWLNPQGEVLYSPAEFISIFESNGFIKKIDFEMFEQACQLVQNLTQRGYNDVIISVNLSKVNFESKTFVEDLMNIISKYNASPKNIELEITETAIMMNASYVSQCIMKLRNMGFHLAMDDFGKEYSSLGALATSPFDTIKLDMVLFQNNLAIDKERAIAKGLIEMLEDLHLNVVCEGISSEKALEEIAKISTDVTVQGFVYSKPIPVSQFEGFLQSTFNHDFVKKIQEEKEAAKQSAMQASVSQAPKKANVTDEDIDEMEELKLELLAMKREIEAEKARKAEEARKERLRKLRDELKSLREPKEEQEVDPYEAEVAQLKAEIESMKASKKPEVIEEATPEEEAPEEAAPEEEVLEEEATEEAALETEEVDEVEEAIDAAEAETEELKEE